MIKRYNNSISENFVHLLRMSKGYVPATIFNQVLPFIMLPIMTRYISASDYGVLSIFGLYQVLCQAMIGSNMPNVVSKHFFDQDKTYVAKLIGNCIYATLALSVVTTIVILVLYAICGSSLVVPLQWLLVLPWGSLAFVILQLGLNVCRNSKHMRYFRFLQVGSTILEMLLSLVLVCVLSWGWVGRAMGTMGAFVVAAIVVLLLLRKHKYLTMTFSMNIMDEIRRVVLPLISYATIMTLIARAGIFCMQYYFTTELSGLYAAAAQGAVFVSLFGDSINVTWSSYLYERLAEKEESNKILITRLLLTLYGILLVGVIGSTLLARPMMEWMTTPEYYDAAEFVFWVAMGIAVSRMYLYLLPILIKNNQQRYINMAACISVVSMLLMNHYFSQWFGYMGIAYAYLATYLIMAVLIFYRAQKVYPLPWFACLKCQ